MARALKAVAPPNIKDVIRKMPEEFLMCRSLGHQWNPYTVYKRGAEYESVLQCGRCHGQRHIFIGINTGKIAKGGYYTYEPGYLVSGWGHMSADERAAIRLAAITLLWNTGEAATA
jgi:hypothetical protein